MERVLVTFKVEPDRVTENEDLVKAVYEELQQINDPDLHYATFKGIANLFNEPNGKSQ